uniref:Uncharacterized protein n=1 Tax=Haptolina ericina TaxID=156174 RepID=A0A7S3ETB4_9EUKA
MVEVENWGGWATQSCPPICGLWGNIWKGTGMAMVVRSPFASLNKGTAVVEMLLELGRTRSDTLVELAEHLRLWQPAKQLCRSFASASLAECVAAQLIAPHPCEGAGRHLNRYVTPWQEYVRSAHPSDLVSALRGLSSPRTNRSSGSRRFVLHWIYGVCGVGSPMGMTGHGWDGLLATLACTLGRQTVVLAASSNDNGLLHQELVDFDLPPGLGWGSGRGNPVRGCLAPFEWAESDRRAGLEAEMARRRALHRYWRASGKFGLPLGAATFSHVLPRSAPTGPCELAFGTPGTDPAGEVSACKIRDEDEESAPTEAKACWAWCNGTMSQAHAHASLFHVRAGANHRPLRFASEAKGL